MQKFGPHEALGTKWWVEFYDEVDESCWNKVVVLITSFELDYSRFIEDSLVGQLNKTGNIAGDLKELPAMLRFGQQQFHETGGLFNILTAGKQVQAGYGHGSTVTGQTESIADPLQDLHISENKITLDKGAVDIGGFGKGWLIDLIKEQLELQGIKHFLINGGGDMYATSLTDGSPIEVFVEHPQESGLFIAKIPLVNQSLAVSSSYKRRWKKAGTEYNHLHVADGVATHVIAETALLADTIATRLCLNLNDLSAINCEYLLWQSGQAQYSKTFKDYLLT